MHPVLYKLGEYRFEIGLSAAFGIILGLLVFNFVIIVNYYCNLLS